MKYDRVWAFPSRWTFTIKPIKQLLAQEVGEPMFIKGVWADAFAGRSSPAQETNDLNPDMPTKYHLDALEFLQNQPENYFDGVLYDPPYSFRQATEVYKSFGKENLTALVTSKKYWANIKNRIAKIIKPGGKVICCGWNSNGLGIHRGFEMTRILLVAHGGSINDTIVTVEVKKL